MYQQLPIDSDPCDFSISWLHCVNDQETNGLSQRSYETGGHIPPVGSQPGLVAGRAWKYRLVQTQRHKQINRMHSCGVMVARYSV